MDASKLDPDVLARGFDETNGLYDDESPPTQSEQKGLLKRALDYLLSSRERQLRKVWLTDGRPRSRLCWPSQRSVAGSIPPRPGSSSERSRRCRIWH